VRTSEIALNGNTNKSYDTLGVICMDVVVPSALRTQFHCH
jgi:hypothetical protein